jgi:hypothetical protein
MLGLMLMRFAPIWAREEQRPPAWRKARVSRMKLLTIWAALCPI